jgi:hypothetical protein
LKTQLSPSKPKNACEGDTNRQLSPLAFQNKNKINEWKINSLI